jgi:hypothetical protein
VYDQKCGGVGERGLGDGAAGREMKTADMGTAVSGSEGHDAGAGRIEDGEWIGGALGEVDDVHVILGGAPRITLSALGQPQ